MKTIYLTETQLNKIISRLVEVGGKDIHTKKWKSCVKQVEKDSPDVNPYAVCTDSLGYEDSIKKKYRKKK